MTDLVEECQSSDGDVDGNTFCWQDRRRSFDDVLSQGVPAVMSDVPAGGVAKVGQVPRIMLTFTTGRTAMYAR